MAAPVGRVDGGAGPDGGAAAAAVVALGPAPPDDVAAALAEEAVEGGAEPVDATCVLLFPAPLMAALLPFHVPLGFTAEGVALALGVAESTAPPANVPAAPTTRPGTCDGAAAAADEEGRGLGGSGRGAGFPFVAAA